MRKLKKNYLLFVFDDDFEMGRPINELEIFDYKLQERNLLQTFILQTAVNKKCYVSSNR